MAASHTEFNPRNGPHDLDGRISATAYTTGTTATTNDSSKMNINNELERDARYKIGDGLLLMRHANFFM